MSDDRLKEEIIESLWQVVDCHDCIQSATLTGSFVNSNSLEGLSDIDFVVVVDDLNEERFSALQRAFQASMQPVLGKAGYALRINPTLGPLKFNEPKLAVLHLMFYSKQAHVDHVINSPFTCLDWQDSAVFRKKSMAEIYPAFGLQPRHFLSARRSISDYLSDFRASVVSFRELVCHASGYTEKKCGKPMDNRDRHEFAYHVMRFLMLNLLKLTRKLDGASAQLSALMDRFFSVFPLGEQDARALLTQLADKKRRIDYGTSIENIGSRLEGFIELFERQFRENFIADASRHVAFRHAPTLANVGPVRFLGRSNLPIIESEDQAGETDWETGQQTLETLKPGAAFASPLERCQRSMQKLLGFEFPITVDERLIEIDYGQCEMLTPTDARDRFPKLFEAWQSNEDPRFPGGENSADVSARILAFAQDRWKYNAPNSVACTHNVVLRCLVGEALGIPPSQRYRIHIPHLAPIEFVSTKNFGLFVNLSESVERELFRGFVGSRLEFKHAS